MITRRSFLSLLACIPLLGRVVPADSKPLSVRTPHGFIREEWLITSEKADLDNVSFEYVLTSLRGDTITITTATPVGEIGGFLWVSRHEL